MTKTLENLIARYEKREEFGLAKYGTTMDRRDLSPVAWAVHLQEELMDASLYVERLRYALALLDEAKVLIERIDADEEFQFAESWLERYREKFGGGG